MEKYSKTFKTLDKRLGVLSKILVASAVIALAFGITAFFIDLKFLAEADYTFQLGDAKLTLAEKAMPEGVKAKVSFAIAAFSSVIDQIFTILLIKFVRDILRPFANGAGMGNSVSKGLKKLTIFTLCYGAVMEIVSFVTSLVLYKIYNVANFFDTTKIIGYEFSYKSTGLFLVIAAVVYILSKVAVYVEDLQAQVDETL